MKKALFPLILLYASSLQAFELGQLFSPPGKKRTVITTSGNLHQDARLTGSETRSQLGFAELSASTPVYQDQDTSWTVSATAREIKMEPNNSPYPDLYDIRIGVGYSKNLENNRTVSLLGGLGSASDKPFNANRDYTTNITGVYTVPIDDQKKWLYMFNYSNNRTFLNNIPLPGIAWMYAPSRDFSFILGLPFAFINWQFSEKWGVNAMTFLPYTHKANIFYKFVPFAQIYGGFEFSQIVHYLHDRASNRERLFFDERKLVLGLKGPINKITYAELETGYAFDRRFFKAEDFSYRPTDATVLGSTPFIRLQLRVAF